MKRYNAVVTVEFWGIEVEAENEYDAEDHVYRALEVLGYATTPDNNILNVDIEEVDG